MATHYFSLSSCNWKGLLIYPLNQLFYSSSSSGNKYHKHNIWYLAGTGSKLYTNIAIDIVSPLTWWPFFTCTTFNYVTPWYKLSDSSAGKVPVSLGMFWLCHCRTGVITPSIHCYNEVGVFLNLLLCYILMIKFCNALSFSIVHCLSGIPTASSYTSCTSL